MAFVAAASVRNETVLSKVSIFQRDALSTDATRRRQASRLATPLAALFGLALFPSVVSAQVGTLNGKVTDAAGLPVVEATVVVKAARGQGLSYRSKTKKDGTFLQLTSQNSGPWTVSVSKDGYRPWETVDPVRVPLGGQPVTLPTITLVRADSAVAAGAPVAAAAPAPAPASGFKAAIELLIAADAAEQAGDATEGARKLDAAEAAFRAALAKDPTEASGHFNLALIHEKRQRWPEAAAAFRQAAQLKPDMAEALLGAATAEINGGRSAEAVAVLAPLQKERPTDLRVQSLLALAQYNQGSYAEAAALYQGLQAASPDAAEPYYYLGMIAMAQNRGDDAMRLLEKYVAMRPSDARTMKIAEDLLQALKMRP